MMHDDLIYNDSGANVRRSTVLFPAAVLGFVTDRLLVQGQSRISVLPDRAAPAVARSLRRSISPAPDWRRKDRSEECRRSLRSASPAMPSRTAALAPVPRPVSTMASQKRPAVFRSSIEGMAFDQDSAISIVECHGRVAQVVVRVAGAFSADCMPVVGSVRMVLTCAVLVPVSVKLELPMRNELLVEMKTR
jgi:hypothetical protein